MLHCRKYVIIINFTQSISPNERRCLLQFNKKITSFYRNYELNFLQMPMFCVISIVLYIIKRKEDISECTYFNKLNIKVSITHTYSLPEIIIFVLTVRDTSLNYSIL